MKLNIDSIWWLGKNIYCKESDTTERLHFHFSLSCIGEGNGNPLQCSCLENPRDGGAWWSAIYGAAQSRTRLKRLSSSISSQLKFLYLTGILLREFHSSPVFKEISDARNTEGPWSNTSLLPDMVHE